jgi:hypothetical protein
MYRLGLLIFRRTTTFLHCVRLLDGNLQAGEFRFARAVVGEAGFASQLSEFRVAICDLVFWILQLATRKKNARGALLKMVGTLCSWIHRWIA